MVGPQQISFGGDVLIFICQEHSVFHSIHFTECSSFSATAFGFRFRFDLHSDLLIFVYQGVFLPLIFIGIHQKFEWCWKREKALCKKMVQEGACVDCGLGFFMSCLMSF
jgi:hypothetical protein